jgi:hypothetical protein
MSRRYQARLVSGFGDTGDLLKSGEAESLADLSEGGALGIRQAHTGGKVNLEDAILGCRIPILERIAVPRTTTPAPLAVRR